MKTTEISRIQGKTNKFSRALNINKKVNLKLKSKSNSKLDIKLTKPIKIKSLNKFKNNLQQNIYNNTQIIKDPLKKENQEKEIDASIDEFIEKELIQPINSNKKLKKNNTTIFCRKHLKNLNDKTPTRIVKNIKTQILSNDINSMQNNRNYQIINNGNIQGKYNLNSTLNNKTPIRLRKINMNKKGTTWVDHLSSTKKEKQMNSLYKNMNMNIYNQTDSNLNNQAINEDSTIINLQEEIENLKRENLYKEMLIKDMKQQLDDIKKDKDKKLIKETSSFPLNNDFQLLKQNLGVLNNKIYDEDLEDNLLNKNIKLNDLNNYSNKDEATFFDKLKTNYSNTKNLITKLINDNEKIKKKINIAINENIKRKNSYLIYEKKKEIFLNFLSNINHKTSDNLDKKIDNNNSNCIYNETDIISNYIENALKSSNLDYFSIKNKIDEEKKNNINLMIKMTLNSNDIKEEEIISLFMNNLFNYQNSIDIFASKFIKTNNLLDKEIIKDYFNLICLDNKNKFNINNIFNEIKSFYDEEVKKLMQNNLNELVSQKKNIFIQIIKECKFIDSLNTGSIEINQFKNILNKFQFFKLFNEDENKIFNILLYNMKKNINKEQIGLFHLFYNNLFEEIPINDSLIKDNLSDSNSLIIEKNEGEKRTSLFYKNNEEKEKNSNEKKIKKKIISNVDFKNYNTKERGSNNSNNTYALLSSQKYSFDYSSKSGSKEAGSLKDGIKEVTSKFIESEEYLETFCKDYVDNLFKICIEEIRRKEKSVYNFEKNVNL